MVRPKSLSDLYDISAGLLFGKQGGDGGSCALSAVRVNSQLFSGRQGEDSG